MQFFVRNCTHILTRTQGKKFEDMFLFKIASKGTSLSTGKCKILRPMVIVYRDFATINTILTFKFSSKLQGKYSRGP